MIEIAVLRGPSHVLYNVHVHVLAFDMYVVLGILGCAYDYECDSASKEAYNVRIYTLGYPDRR